jgi:NADH-quinone oxidoreductase subunit C
VVYHLLSYRHAHTFALKVHLTREEPLVDTVEALWPVANWHEREAFEMFGISFDGHPNLIKLYLPSDFQGHPLRKDFPLLARRVRPWPGIVDVEPMPGGDDSEGDGE